MTLVLFLGGFLLVALGANALGWRYFINIWYAADVLVNAIGRGDARETVSSAWGKQIARGDRLAIAVARAAFLTTHFKESVNEDVGDRAVPVAAMIVGLVWLLVAALAVFG